MRKITLTEFDLNEFVEVIRSVVKQEIEESQKLQHQEKFLSASEVCTMLGISRGTLINWVKDGRINEHRIGQKKFYRNREIIESMRVLKKFTKLEAVPIKSIGK